tara:strand:- start:17076 stop:17450 length:375 start_codon:yes stop_codon:yes gene_type:complete
MDWSPLLQALIGLAAAAVPVIAGKLWFWLEEKIKASAVNRLGAAAERAAGQVMESITDPRLAPALADARQAAIDAATMAMQRTMADTISRLGGKPSQIEAMIKGELGILLSRQPAADPAANDRS